VTKKTIFLILFLLCAWRVEAATYFVATTGSDSNSCAAATNSATPKRNIMGASGGVACVTAPGDIVDIRAGNYPEAIGVSISAGHPTGTAGSPITVRGHVGETVTVRQIGAGDWTSLIEYWNFDNFTVQNVSGNHVGVGTTQYADHITVSNVDVVNADCMGVQGFSSFFTFRNSKIRNTGANCPYSDPHAAQVGYGVYWIGRDSLFEYNEIFGNHGFGIHNYSDPGQSYGMPHRNVYRYNKVYGNCTDGAGGPSPERGTGILVSSGDDNQVYGNIVYDNIWCQRGIETGLSFGQRQKIFNNTVYNNATASGSVYYGVFAGLDAVVRNNIIYNNGINGVDLYSGATSNFNFCDANDASCGATQVNGNPQFVNAAGGNFSLASNSTAINAGTSAIATGITACANGSAPDMGALETLGNPTASVNGAAITITFVNNCTSFMLPATGTVTGFSVKRANIPNAIVSLTRLSANVFSGTLQTAFNPAPEACLFSYAQSTGNTFSNNNIGNLTTSNQELFDFTDVACTNVTGGPSGSVLSVAAAALPVGQWVQILPTPTGISEFLTGNGGSLAEFANKGVWDPIRKKMFFCGASHLASIFYSKCVQYDEATNTISQIALIPGVPAGPVGSGNNELVHAYDRNTFDTSRGLFYYRHTNNVIYKYNPNTNSWTQGATGPSDCGQAGDTGALEYFPDVDKVYLISGNCNFGFNFAEYDPATNTWSEPTNKGSFVHTELNQMAAYSKQGFMYGGGGNPSAFGQSSVQTSRLRSSVGAVAEQMPNSPVGIFITGSNMVADPASGRILNFPYGGTVRVLNPCPTKPCAATAKVWTNTSAPSTVTDPSIVIPVSNYGVVMAIRKVGASHDMWIYKHATQPDGDFTARTDLPGVVLSNGFDVIGDLGPANTVSGFRGYSSFETCGAHANNCPFIGTDFVASGAGSLKFIIPSGNNGAFAGYFWTNPMPDLSIRWGENETVNLQYRVRHNAGYINNFTGWKSSVFTAADTPTKNWSSCTNADFVVQRTGNYLFPTLYQGCPGTNQPINGDMGAGDLIWQERPAPGCIYPNFQNCFLYYADEWVTYKFQINFGALGSVSRPGYSGQAYMNTRIRWWAAREGQPSDLIMDQTFNWNAEETGIVQEIGKIFLMPYSGSEVSTAQVMTHYDELIMSHEDIADPGFAAAVLAGDSTPPVVLIDTPTTNPTYSTNSSTVNLAGSCTDNIACTQVTWVNSRGGSGTATLTTGWTANGIALQAGENVITVTGRDAALNQATDIITVTMNLPAAPTAGLKFSGSTGLKLGPGAGVKVGE
jgi:hypothetical protein